jgi:hypothetical protein
MNVCLLLGSGRLRTTEPITQVTASSVPENELDSLNKRLDSKQISFIDYLGALEALLQKGNTSNV